jgi:hypothetical protein
MSVMPEPGMPVVVVLRSADPKQWTGEVVALRDSSLAIRMPAAVDSWNAALPFMVICGEPGGRFSAPARFVARKDAVAAFKLLARWKALDLRRSPRFTTDFKAEVRSVLGTSRQSGRVVDISAGGAAVAVDQRPGGNQIEVGITANGYSARIVCDVLHTSEVGTETILHVRFHEMSAPHQAFIRQLVASLIEAEARRAS